ncbi:MAG: prepilin-type N-terminal cleavage/methylation domain-containing protein [Candidatus Pacebacteria bacterium]|nr:prepilin-type N-terminal cleavage/methylation domain-containing protein [Candidatus Paceibacterota bacterium]MDD5357300.1 prepilin-type N-terminal cleavage/methylation domain-containing protein [Candidatus Paceibacterota bacterium]
MKLFSNNFPAQKGFSVLEFLVVIAIFAIIASLTFSSFSSLRQSKTLETDTLSVLSLLEKARADTLGSKGATQYGVHFETTKATLFTGATYSSGNASNISVIFNPRVQISTISLTGGTSNVVFQRLSGKTSVSGTVTLSLTGASSTKIISIAGTGLSQIQ